MAATTVLDESGALFRYVAARSTEADLVSAQRRAQLRELAGHVRDALDEGRARLTFICTHNSRRSQMSQIWARVAAAHVGLQGVEAFSGGTEATAFNPRAVAALQRAGLEIQARDNGENPVYRVSWTDQEPGMECWSKGLTDSANPGEAFVAVMTCSDADGACPVVPGATQRFSLTYEDPKDFDGTDREREAYDERCEQIAREMLLLCRFVERSEAQGAKHE